MAKAPGEKSSKMDLVTFENLIRIARRYNVDSFSYGDVSVNLGADLSDIHPDPVNNPGGSMNDELYSTDPEGDILLTSPTMRA